MDELTLALLDDAISQGASGNADIVGALETAFADLVDARYALCTASGTAALICALWAVGVRPGDAVAVSALGPAMTGLAVTAVGARPVFLDSADPSSFGVNPQAAERAIGLAPKAAVVVPMWGYWDERPAALDMFGRHRIPVVVDGAQAPFLRLQDGLCEVADIVCLSLHGRKPFKAGEGGVCLTNHRQFADLVVQIRNFGQGTAWDGRRLTPAGAFGAGRGVNFKMNGLGAAWCLAQVQAADQLRERLASLKARAIETLGVTGIRWTEATQSTTVLEHGRYGIVAICPDEQDAKRLALILDERGIEVDTSRYHYRPMYHAAHLSRFATTCPNAEHLTRHAVACRLEAFTAARLRADPPPAA
jgi:dTDP-4-amino-4,6-dideoxygalactose transaminase